MFKHIKEALTKCKLASVKQKPYKWYKKFKNGFSLVDDATVTITNQDTCRHIRIFYNKDLELTAIFSFRDYGDYTAIKPVLFVKDFKAQEIVSMDECPYVIVIGESKKPATADRPRLALPVYIYENSGRTAGSYNVPAMVTLKDHTRVVFNKSKTSITLITADRLKPGPELIQVGCLEITPKGLYSYDSLKYFLLVEMNVVSVLFNSEDEPEASRLAEYITEFNSSLLCNVKTMREYRENQRDKSLLGNSWKY